MRWMIGLDLADRSLGALQLAGWLRTASPAQEFAAVHVLDERLRRLLRTDQQDELRARAERELSALIDASEARPAVVARSIVTADSPEHGITEAIDHHSCDALIIGRLAERKGRHLVRLGAVARRLVRRLPKPVLVVPPDVTAAALGKGPLLLTTDLSAASVPAAAFARRLANELGRELVVVHVEPGFDFVPTFWGEPIILPDATRRVPADVDAWARSQGLGEVRTRLAEGTLLDNVFDIAKLEDAPIIVCGSRGLATLDRIFVSSTSVDLARHADRPVVVVPSH